MPFVDNFLNLFWCSEEHSKWSFAWLNIAMRLLDRVVHRFPQECGCGAWQLCVTCWKAAVIASRYCYLL